MGSLSRAALGCLLAIAIGKPHDAQASTLRVPQDHDSIQAALDAASSGDTVLVAAGTYRERIRLKQGVALRSAGSDEKGMLGLKRAEAVVIDGGGVGEQPGVLMAPDATLDGVTVTNCGLYEEAKWKEDWETRGENQKHEHIGHFGTPAIGVVGATCVIVNCIVHHNGDTGIGIRGEKDKVCSPLVARNVCYRNMGGGIGSMNGSTATVEDNICFENLYAGIGHDAAHPIVRRNRCYGNVRAGIGISNGSCPIVRNNTCYGNRRAGIGVRSTAATQPVIEQNECYENEMAGIGSEDESQPIIRGNRCHHNKQAGIGSRNHASPIIVGNECVENNEAGIGSREGARPLIVRNTSSRNAAAGIGIQDGATVAVVVENRCVDNSRVALGLPDGATAFVHGNHFERVGGMPPLVAIRGQSNALMTDNEIRGGGVAGILVQGRAKLDGNRFFGRGPGQGIAVWIWEGSHVDVADNRFEGYANAVNATASRVSVTGNTVQDFQKTAIIVRKPSAPPVVANNVAISTEESDTPVQVDGGAGYIQNNAKRAAAAENVRDPQE